MKAYIKLTFSEYGHVAYQIKGNEAYNYMLANDKPLDRSLTPGGSKVIFFLFCKLHVELNGNEAENTMQANTLPFKTPTAPRWDKKVKTIFF